MEKVNHKRHQNANSSMRCLEFCARVDFRATAQAGKDLDIMFRNTFALDENVPASFFVPRHICRRRKDGKTCSKIVIPQSRAIAIGNLKIDQSEKSRPKVPI